MMARIRGIKNVTGVGCHLSCALLILCYSLIPLRDAIILLFEEEEDDKRSKVEEVIVVFQLARLLKEMTTNTYGTSAVDPSNFFQVIQNDCNAYDLGDATKALTVLLQCIKKGLILQQEKQLEEGRGEIQLVVKEIRQEFQSLYEFLLCGTKEQIICGRKRRTFTSTTVVRTKRKISPLMNPFPLQILKDSSIQEAIQFATTQAIPIKGCYNWDGIPSETYKEEIVDKDQEEEEEEEEKCHQWVTTKQQQFVSLPVFFMLHLQRFQYNNNARGKLQASQQIIDIPLCLQQLDYTYQLVGGILHSDYEDDDEPQDYDDYEGGHYTTLLRSPQQPQQPPNSSDGNEEDVDKDPKKWNLVDGAKVTEFSQQDALDLLSGKPTTTTVEGEASSSSSSSSTTRGTLLVYSRQYTTDEGEQQAQPDETIHQMLDRIRTLVSKAKESEGCSSLFSTSQTQTKTSASLSSPLSKLLPAAAEAESAAIKDACNNNDPMQLIGKRLRIRWSGGTFYSGIIVEYNPSTNKHTVRYDDGDIKQYKLHKKVIEWD